MGVTEIMAGIRAVQEAIEQPAAASKGLTLYDEPPAQVVVFPSFVNVEQREDVVRGMGLRQRDMYFSLHLLFAPASQKYAVRERRLWVDAVLDTFDASGVQLGGQVTQAWIESIEDEPVQLGEHQYVASTFVLRVEQKQAFDFGSDLIPAIGESSNMQVIYKTADQDNDTDVMVEDAELRFPVEANSRYFFRLTLFYVPNTDEGSGGAGQMQWSLPTGATGVKTHDENGTSTSANGSLADPIALEGVDNPDDQNNTCRWGLLQTTDAGEVVMEFSNAVGSIGTTTSKAGSLIEVFKVE